jgi:hypothetical protein
MSKARVDTPTDLMQIPEIAQLYKKVASKIKNKTGALMDEIRLIFHDYDMNDHFFSRIASFTSNQSDTKHLAIDYTIEIECYEPDTIQRNSELKVKPSVNESLDRTNTQIQQIPFETVFNDIQGEIGYNYSFLNTIVNITDLLTKISAENENIQAGKSTLSVNMPIYVNDLLTSLDLASSNFITTFLSIGQRTDYDNGDLTIDEVVNIDLLTFYNTIKKIKLQANILNGIIKSTVIINELKYYSDADDYTLTEEQFTSPDAGRTENTTNFYYYEVMEGDTLRSIALKELKDQEKYIQILKFNGISENDFIDGTLIGQKIKIPFPIGTTARGDDNLVYETDYSDPEKFVFGSGFAFGLNNELLLASGKLKICTGIENAFKAVENRIKNKKGSLNVFNPNWGTFALDDSNTPMLVKIDRYLTDMLNQIQSDPRVESAKMDLKKLVWDGESISVPTKIFFINSEQTREVTV